jgi:hypothetical protein
MSQAPSPYSVMQRLVAADGIRFSAEDLAHLADAAEVAEQLARQAAAVAEGIGSLIDSDRQQAPAGDGSLQGDEQTPLVYLLGTVLSTVAGLIHVSSVARHELSRVHAGGR